MVSAFPGARSLHTTARKLVVEIVAHLSWCETPGQCMDHWVGMGALDLLGLSLLKWNLCSVIQLGWRSMETQYFQPSMPEVVDPLYRWVLGSKREYQSSPSRLLGIELLQHGAVEHERCLLPM